MIKEEKENIFDKYYSEEEVSKFLNKTIQSLRIDACKRKGAPRTKIGKKILYNKTSFEKWIEEKEKKF